MPDPNKLMPDPIRKPLAFINRWSICYTLIIGMALLSACHFDGRSAQKPAKTNNLISDKLQELKTGIHNFPDSADLRANYASILLQEGRVSEALLQYDSMLITLPNQAHIYNLRAVTYLGLKDTGKAIRDYETALQLDPLSEAALNLAYLYALQGNSKALELCDTMIMFMDKKNPSADPFFIKGIYFFQQKDTAKGLQAMHASISTDHNFMEAYIEKGRIHFLQNNITEARKTFLLASRVDAHYVEAFYWLGRCEEALKDIPAAKSMYKKCLNLDPAHAAAKEALERLQN